jgi:hypothetical protein
VQLQIITLYCWCDEFLTAYGHRDAPNAQMTTAEVMTVALVAAACFDGQQERSRVFLQEHGYIPTMLSKSRFNRRLHALPECLWQAFFAAVAQVHQQANLTDEYLIDSFPVAVCDNIRIKRNRLYGTPEFRGYHAAMRRYFYGLRVHLVCTVTGQPVELVLLPGSIADISGLKRLPLELPAGATLYADAGYTDYAWEDGLAAEADLHLVALRRGNSKRSWPAHVRYLCQRQRKRIETRFSQITAWLARRVHAVTARGFELKLFLTVLAFSILS